MKKNIILLITLIIIGNQLSAQKLKDVLYLKNGSIINGTLMEITDNQYKIRTSDGSLFIFNSGDVDKYSKETPAYDGRKKDGFGFALEAGFLVGSQNSEYPVPFSFNFLANFTSDKKNIFGIGSGVEYIGKTFTPFFFEYKHLLYDRIATPFIFLRGGGLLHLAKDEEVSNLIYPQYNNKTDFKGGVSAAIGTGISWAKEDFETYLSFAYRYARTSYIEKNYLQQDVTYENTYNRLEVKFGFKF